MEFDSTLLILSLVPSGAGFVLFTYGRKQQRWPHLLCGILLMAYPYFAGSVIAMVAGSIALGVGLYVMIAAGW
jgi:hypothetical protein